MMGAFVSTSNIYEYLETPRREVHFDVHDGDSGERQKSLTDSAFPKRQSHQIASTHDTASTHQASPNTPGKLKPVTNLNSYEPLLDGEFAIILHLTPFHVEYCDIEGLMGGIDA